MKRFATIIGSIWLALWLLGVLDLIDFHECIAPLGWCQCKAVRS